MTKGTDGMKSEDAPTAAAGPESSTASTPQETEVMTVDEAAALIRVNRKTVYEAINRGDLPHQRVGRKIRLSRTALVAWISQGQGRVSRSRRKKQ